MEKGTGMSGFKAGGWVHWCSCPCSFVDSLAEFGIIIIIYNIKEITLRA